MNLSIQEPRGLVQMAEDGLQKERGSRSAIGVDAGFLQKELESRQDEIRSLQSNVLALQAEIGRMRGSLSWKITAPLRSAARRAPGLTGFVQRKLDIMNDAIASALPKRVSRALLDNRWDLGEGAREQIEAYRRSQRRGGRKVVFYTAIFGEYDTLLLPERLDPDVDYVCFTDRPRNNYGVWQMRLAPYYHPDLARVARYVKTHPHALFPNYDIAVWLDGNIILKGDLHSYIERVKHEDAHIGLVSHPHRDCFYEEAEACKRLKKDNAKTINRQVEHYRKHGLPQKQPLYETGFMIVSLKDQETKAALHTWWQQIDRFSRRDQLSLAWVLHEFPELRITSLLPQGMSVRDHESFTYFRHKYARALTIPEALLRLGTVVAPGDGISFSEVKEQRLKPLADVPIDIIVCVHNALEDVRLCLSSVLEHLLPAHKLIVVNDRSNEETTAYLRAVAVDDTRIRLIENEENLGYTLSASRGLAAGTAAFRILLNSDTIVSRNWALKMLDTANRSEKIGIVGPLSNAAGAQSIPQIKSKGNNTAINQLPSGLDPAAVDLACEEWSLADLNPRVPLVHGFCFGVKQEVIDAIGLFDAENFKRFYGEENDYCFRATAAGFELAVVTNTFVFHRKSRSIDEEKRVVHMAEAWKRLRDLYGADNILAAYRQVEEHPLLERIRSKAQSYFQAASAHQSGS